MTKSIIRRLAYISIVAISLFSLMLLGVIPVQEWFEVRDTKDELLVELAKVEELNESYRVSIDALKTDEEIERIARSEYSYDYGWWTSPSVSPSLTSLHPYPSAALRVVSYRMNGRPRSHGGG